MKQQYLHRRLVEALPPVCNECSSILTLQEFEDFMNHLKTLEYEAKPDYKYLLTMFGNLYARLGGTPTTPFEWEVNPQPRTSSNPIDIRPKKVPCASSSITNTHREKKIHQKEVLVQGSFMI